MLRLATVESTADGTTAKLAPGTEQSHQVLWWLENDPGEDSESFPVALPAETTSRLLGLYGISNEIDSEPSALLCRARDHIRKMRSEHSRRDVSLYIAGFSDGHLSELAPNLAKRALRQLEHVAQGLDNQEQDKAVQPTGPLHRVEVRRKRSSRRVKNVDPGSRPSKRDSAGEWMLELDLLTRMKPAVQPIELSAEHKSTDQTTSGNSITDGQLDLVDAKGQVLTFAADNTRVVTQSQVTIVSRGSVASTAMKTPEAVTADEQISQNALVFIKQLFAKQPHNVSGITQLQFDNYVQAVLYSAIGQEVTKKNRNRELARGIIPEQTLQAKLQDLLIIVSDITSGKSIGDVAHERRSAPATIKAQLGAAISLLRGYDLSIGNDYLGSQLETFLGRDIFIVPRKAAKGATVSMPRVASRSTTDAQKPPAVRRAATRAHEPGNDAKSGEAFDWDDTEESENPAVEMIDLDEVAKSADLVRVYLTDIGKVALLSAADEVTLSKQIEAGLYAGHLLQSDKDMDPQHRRELRQIVKEGETAKDLMLRANLRLVVSLAKRYTGRSMEFLDLIQEGNLGLNRAVEKFDYKKGYKFSTYATWWIRQAISRAMADQGHPIRLPVHMVEELNKTKRIKKEMDQLLGRDVTYAELAKELGVTEARVDKILKLGRPVLSLDQTVGDDGDTAFGDLIADNNSVATETNYDKHELNLQVGKVLDTLEGREAEVMSLRFGLNGQAPMTLDEIGRRFKLSRERIRQIEREATAKLRHPSRATLLKDYIAN